MKKLTLEEIRKKIFEIHGDTLILDESTYKNSYTRCKFIDKDYGERWTTLSNVIYHKKTHPKRGRQLAKQIMLEKYGVENPIKNKDIKEKIKQTCLKKYNAPSPLESKSVQEKIKQTILEKYGVDNPIKNKDIKEKIKQTCLKKYGVENPSQNKDIKKRASNTFKTKYGKKGKNYKKIQEKRKKTNIEKYGVDNPIKLRKILLSALKKSNRSNIAYHWKTQEELVCVGSYERKTVEWLNKNKINFDWQISFNMPNNKIYTIDLYLIDKDIWVEIKGRKYEVGMKKWNWFHKKYSNSELWDKKKLKEMKVL